MVSNGAAGSAGRDMASAYGAGKTRNLGSERVKSVLNPEDIKL